MPKFVGQVLVLLLFVFLNKFYFQGREGKCQLRHCDPIQQVLSHALNCDSTDNCPVKYCRTARRLIYHYDVCTGCPICLFACEANGLGTHSERPKQLFYKLPDQHNSPCGTLNCNEFVW